MSRAETYNIEIDTPLGMIPGTLVLNIDQPNISGTCSTSKGSASVTGKFVSEKDVLCSTNVNTPVGNLDLKISGKFDGDRLSGKAKAGIWGSFPFKGQKVQA
jgi:hypothetical protein